MRVARLSPDETVDRVLPLMWQHGYARVSLNDMLEATGLPRQTLYNHFGDKHSIFIACLQRYQALALGEIHARLRNKDGMDALRAAFAMLVDQYANPPRRGCLMANSVIEFAGQDAAIGTQCRDYLEQLIGCYQPVMQQIAVDASCDPAVAEQTSRIAAWRLVNAQIGLATLSRTGVDAAILRAVADDALASVHTLLTSQTRHDHGPDASRR